MSSNAAIDQFCAAVDASTSSQVDTYVNDGIDGDLRHAGEGYHTWRDKLASPWSDYSSGLASARNSNPRDLGGPGNQSCATDLGFDHDDMIAVTQALFDAARRGDPRMGCVREVNGWLGGANPVNIDHELGWQQNYTPDSSHKSHVHIGFYRDVAGNWDAIKGVVDIITGASSGTTTQGGVAVPITSEEDDMTPDQATKLDAIYNRLTARTDGDSAQWMFKDTDGVWKPTANQNTPGAVKIQLLDSLDGQTLNSKLEQVLSRLAALEAK